jgi:hypothetical protein
MRSHTFWSGLPTSTARGRCWRASQYAHDEAEPPQNLAPLALVAAERGELDRARELAEEIFRLAELHGVRLSMPAAVRAIVDLWSGDPVAAFASFSAAEQTENAPDCTEPGMCWWRAEQVEALLELGHVEDAVARLDAWERDARRLGHDWVLAHATRCRGLVAAATGDVERSLSLLAEAVSRHETVGDPFGRARALLALGVNRRRTRQKRRTGGDRSRTGRVRGAGRRRLGRADRPRARHDRRTGPDRGPDAGGAARRRARGEGAHELGGRGDAVPRRAHGRYSPDARVREARRPLANRARPEARDVIKLLP